MFKRVIKEEYKAPADINNLSDMRDFITRIGRKYGVAEQIINSFKMAIDEAGTNIIRHAYRDWEGFITIRMIIRESSVTVSLIDQGHTFDPRNVKDPDLQRYVDIGKKGGLGIFIIRRIIDEIDYRKTVEGNELRLTKKRDVTRNKKIVLPDVSFSMKTRFSLTASIILTVIVLTGFIITFLGSGKKILREDLEAGRVLALSVAHNSLDFLVNADEEYVELLRIAAETYRNHKPLVTEIIIVDSLSIIKGVATRPERLFDKFVVPHGAKKINKNTFLFEINKKRVFDVVMPAAISEGAVGSRSLGTVHLLMDRKVIYSQISAAHRRIIFTALIILLGGYLGIFTLVYITMSPFKKLSKWIKALGKDEAHDVLEFDSTDEVGEIAKAFNEITEKFRRSQVNLAEQERLQKEMQVAQEIQQTLLPDSFPDIEGYEIASYYEAAKEVGGDYFDFVEVDSETLGIVVADVSGKGVPGSLVMTMIRTALRTEARGNKNAADVLAKVNEFVIKDMKKGMFVTVFYVILDSHNRTINYASAGHNPMILYRGATQKSYYLNPRGFPIGINLPDNSLFRKSIESDSLRLQEGDDLIIYTDGITEAMNPNRERFGDERFLTTLRKFGHLNVKPLVNKIQDEIGIFSEGYAQSDDITLVAIREKMQADDVLFNMRKKLFSMVKEEGKTIKEACEISGVSTSTYYKYKKLYKKSGDDGLREKVRRSEIEEKHISIEDRTKIYDIIKKNPEYGAKRICEILNTEKYEFVVIDDKYIYDELVRSRLNTKELRMAFVERGGRGKRMKPPGTPFMTLDGQVIVEPVGSKKPVGVHPFVKDEKEDTKPVDNSNIADADSDEQAILTDKPEEDQDIKHAADENLLDDFLGLTEDTEEVNSEDAITSELEEDFNTIDTKQELDVRGETSVTDEEELVVDTVDTDQPELSDEEADMTELLDSFIDDIDTSEIQDRPVSIEPPSLDKILETGESDLPEIDIDQIEERITSSSAGDLLGEDIGIDQELSVSATEKPEGDDDFIKMMEGIGLDRREVLADSKMDVDQSKLKKSLNLKRLLEAGMWFYNQGLYEKAIGEFNKAVKENPLSVTVNQCLADSYFRMGRLDKAKELYDKVRQLDPSNVSVLENLGVIFANMGDYKKAVWQWGEVLKNNPDRRDIIERIKKMQQVIRKQVL